MNTALSCAVTTRDGVLHAPPDGVTTSPGGTPLVRSASVGGVSFTICRFHCIGKALVSVKTSAACGGAGGDVTNASVGGATVTTGLTASSRAGESGGAAWPGGIGAGVLSSIVLCVSCIVRGR